MNAIKLLMNDLGLTFQKALYYEFEVQVSIKVSFMIRVHYNGKVVKHRKLRFNTYYIELASFVQYSVSVSNQKSVIVSSSLY